MCVVRLVMSSQIAARAGFRLATTVDTAVGAAVMFFWPTSIFCVRTYYPSYVPGALEYRYEDKQSVRYVSLQSGTCYISYVQAVTPGTNLGRQGADLCRWSELYVSLSALTLCFLRRASRALR